MFKFQALIKMRLLYYSHIQYFSALLFPLKLSVTLGMLLFISTAIAQSQDIAVSGTIRNAQNAEPIFGAEIYNSQLNNVQYSNVNGQFSLRIPAGAVSITFWMNGFNSQIFDLDLMKDTVLNVNLISKSFELEEVVISPIPKSFSIRSLGKVAVNTEQVKFAPSFLGEQDIVKYLQMLPGITSGFDGSSQLLVRGGSSDQTLIMLDDTPIYNQNHAFGYLSIFNNDVLSGAELYKSYIPTQYGSRLSSVAAFKMRDGNKYKHQQSITFGTIAASLMAEGPIVKDKGSYIISGRRFMPDILFIRPAISLTKKGNDDVSLLYYFYDLNAKVNYQLSDKHTLYASFYNSKDKLSSSMDRWEFKRKIVNQPDGANLTSKTIYTKSAESSNGFQWINTSSSIRLSSLLSQGIAMNNVIYYTSLKNRESAFFYNRFDENRSTSVTRSELEEIGLRSTIEYPISANHRITYGVNGAYTYFNPRQTSEYTNIATTTRKLAMMELLSFSLFGEDEYSFGSYRMNLGIRASMYLSDNKQFTMEPRIVLSKALGSKKDIWVAYSRSNQPLFSVTSIFMELPMVYWLPSIGKRLERSDQFSIGGSTRSFKNFELSAEIFFKSYANLSYLSSTQNYLQKGEIPRDAKGYAYGLEMMAQYSLSRFSFNTAYTYSRSMRKVEGVLFPYTYDIPHNLNVYTTYTTLRNKIKKHTLSLNLVYRSGLPFRFSDTQVPVPNGTFGLAEISEHGGATAYPEYVNMRMNPYFQANISFSMERQKQNGSRIWQFSLLNATNHINPSMIYRYKNEYRYFTTLPILPSITYKRTFR